MDKETIINLNQGLIYDIAKKFYGINKEDLWQAGRLGIVKAYDNYKKNGTTKFSSYAYMYIFGEMAELCIKERQIKVSSNLLRLNKKIELARYKLAQKLNRMPSSEEIAIYLEMDINIINSAIMATNSIYSLDANNDDDRSFYESIPDEENIPIEDKIFLNDALDILNEQERKIINYRYYEDLTQSEVAKKLKLNQAKVSRCEKRSLEKMHEYSKVA